MANSQREKQRQFGLKLLFIALIVALVFTVWYLSDKRERNVEGPVSPITPELEMTLSGENSVNLEDLYLEEAKVLMQNNYQEIQLDANFSLHVFETDGVIRSQKNLDEFWTSFKENYGVLDVGSVTYNVSGDVVKIYFQTNLNDAPRSFWRLAVFEPPVNTATSMDNKPVLLEDMIIVL